jgi:hypothetical protein
MLAYMLGMVVVCMPLSGPVEDVWLCLGTILRLNINKRRNGLATEHHRVTILVMKGMIRRGQFYRKLLLLRARYGFA